MSSMRLHRANHQVLFWVAFGVASTVIAVVTVVGFSPRSPLQISPLPAPEAAEARSGKLIIDTGGENCKQVSFNNDTGEITGISLAPCTREGLSVPKLKSAGQGNVINSMRKAFGPNH